MASDAAQEWKILGNKYFSKAMYVGALKSYNSGLEEDPESVLLLSNRSATYLKLRAFESALKDANDVLKIEPLHVKATYRKIKALCGLKRYHDASEFIDKVNLSPLPQSDQTEIEKLKLKIKDYLHQEKTGDYDIVFMLKAALQNRAFHFDYADYVGPIEERESPSKGRGLFATEDIKAGQLLIGCKAFALLVTERGFLVHNVNQFLPLDAVPFVERDNEALAGIVTKILTEAPEKGKELYKLYAGPKLGYLSPENGDDTSHVDLKRIKSICVYNAFEPRLQMQSFPGIWLLPSLINHMCYGCNCHWMVFGDFMLIRALKPISKDEELSISYIELIITFTMRMEFFERHGFSCDCRLCELERKETGATHEKFEQCFEELMTFYDSMGDGITDTSRLTFYINWIKSLRPKNFELNFHLVLPLMVLGIAYSNRRETTRRPETSEKLYKLISNTPLCCSTITVLNLIVNDYLDAGAMKEAKKWICRLRETILIAYGNLGVSNVLFQLVITKQRLLEKGLSL